MMSSSEKPASLSVRDLYTDYMETCKARGVPPIDRLVAQFQVSRSVLREAG